MTSRQTTMSTRRRLSSLAVALVSTLVLSGCFVNSPAQTTRAQDHGYHIGAGDLKILDLLVISRGNGAPGIVTGYAANEGADPLEMQMAVEIEGVLLPLGRSITVLPGKGVRLDGRDAGVDGGPEIEPLIVPEVPMVTGSVITVRVTTAQAAASVRVGVMPPEAPYDIYDNELS